MKPQPTFTNIYSSNSPFWWNMQELFRPREHFLVFQRLVEYVHTCSYLLTFYQLFNNWRYVSINVHVLSLKSQIFFNKTPPRQLLAKSSSISALRRSYSALSMSSVSYICHNFNLSPVRLVKRLANISRRTSSRLSLKASITRSSSIALASNAPS